MSWSQLRVLHHYYSFIKPFFMHPLHVKLKLKTFDILVQNESSPDEPYIWVVRFRVDGTSLNPLKPEECFVHVGSVSGRHGNLGPDSDDEESSEAPLLIPAEIGEWDTTIDAGSLFPQVIPSCAIATLVLAFEEDMSTSTDAMEDARKQFVHRLRDLLNERLRDAVRAIGNGDEIDVNELTTLPVDALKNIIKTVVVDGITRNLLITIFSGIPLLAFFADGDDFVGWRVAGPYTIPELIGYPGSEIPFELKFNNGEDDESGYYLIKGSVSTDFRKHVQLAAWQTLQGDYTVLGRGANVDKFFRKKFTKATGTWKNFSKIGEGVFKSGPAAAITLDKKEAFYFGLGMDDKCWWAYSDNEGNDMDVAWKQIPVGSFLSGFAAAAKLNGDKIYLFGRGLDKKIWWAYSTDNAKTWQGWWPIGNGVFTSAPAACCSADGKLVHVFGRGNDNAVWRASSYDGGATWVDVWTPIPNGKLASQPAVVCNATGKKIWLFGRGLDKKMWYAFSDNEGKTWRGWWPFASGTFISGPAVCASPDGNQINIFGVGENMNVYHNQSNDGGTTFNSDWTRLDKISTFY